MNDKERLEIFRKAWEDTDPKHWKRWRIREALAFALWTIIYCGSALMFALALFHWLLPSTAY